jgi:DNA-directed RNA polymerase specialized sigma24 family protein
VAEALGVKLGTVRSRIHRGRTMLREKLAHRDPRPQQSRPKLSLPRIAGIL